MGWAQDAYDRAKTNFDKAAMWAGIKHEPAGHVGDGFSLYGAGNADKASPEYGSRARAYAQQEKPYLDAAVARFEKAPDAEVVKLLGSPKDREAGREIPAHGAARRNEIRQMALLAFTDPRLTSSMSPHTEDFRARTLPRMRDPERIAEVFSGKQNIHDANTRFTGEMVNRTVHLHATGKALDARIEGETRAIMAAPDFKAEVADRFHRSPKTDLQGPPKDVEGRREWVSGALRTEAAFLSKALIQGDDVMDIAAVMRGPVPKAAPDVGVNMVQTHVNAGWVEKRDYEEAKNLEKLPDAALRHRFRSIPGIETAEIDKNRVGWVAQASSIERTRDVMRSAGVPDHAARTPAPTSHDKAISVSKDSAIDAAREKPTGITAEARRPGIAAQAAAAMNHRGVAG